MNQQTKKCKFCKSEIDNKASICPICKKSQSSAKNTIVLVILILIVFFVFGIYYTLQNENSPKDLSDYIVLDIQELHNDYISNEIAAKDKYVGNYYSFTSNIHDITQFLNDNYLTFRNTYNQDNSKFIEINAYFDNEDDIKDVKKGDEITVYCKFKHRSIENYMNTITSYSLEKCRLK